MFCEKSWAKSNPPGIRAVRKASSWEVPEFQKCHETPVLRVNARHDWPTCFLCPRQFCCKKKFLTRLLLGLATLSSCSAVCWISFSPAICNCCVQLSPSREARMGGEWMQGAVKGGSSTTWHEEMNSIENRDRNTWVITAAVCWNNVWAPVAHHGSPLSTMSRCPMPHRLPLGTMAGQAQIAEVKRIISFQPPADSERPRCFAILWRGPGGEAD